jgi:hypothetical protein
MASSAGELDKRGQKWLEGQLAALHTAFPRALDGVRDGRASGFTPAAPAILPSY